MVKNPATELAPKAYLKLVAELRAMLMKTLATAAQARNETRIGEYWRIGRRLSRVRLDSGVNFHKLSADLKVAKNLLYRTVQLFDQWPEGLTPETTRLPWSHHIVLGGLKNRAEVAFYVKTALEQGWTAPTLARAVRRGYFAAYKNDPVQTMSSWSRPADPMHFYKARLEKINEDVVDGDTIVALVDLGFNNFTRQRFRLRGVNASELAQPDAPSKDGALAERAKAFVIQKLSSVKFFVVKSHKLDAFGRFIADVFYHPQFENKIEVATKGIWLNEELVANGLAKPSYV